MEAIPTVARWQHHQLMAVSYLQEPSLAIPVTHVTRNKANNESIGTAKL